MMRDRCRGLDEAEVAPDDTVKSVSSEMSFAVDLTDERRIKGAIATMAAKTCRRLRKQGRKGSTVTLKVRFGDLKIRSAQKRLDSPTDDEFTVAAVADGLLSHVWAQGMPLRLVGVALSRFDEEPRTQPSLFANEETPDEAKPTVDADKRAGLIRATDKIKDRFGEDAVRFGREREAGASSTGSAAKNPEDYKS